MGFFDDLKKEISQAVTELVSDEELLKEEDDYSAGMKNTMSQSAGAVDTEYLDEDDYIETEDDYKEDEPQSMGVVVDDLASDEYVNTMKIDIKDLIASYSDELSADTKTESLEKEDEEQYDDGRYQSEYEEQYISAPQTAGEQYMSSLPEEEEAPQAMDAMNALGLSDELARMYGDDDDVMVNTLDDDVFEEDAVQNIEPEQVVQEAEEQPEELSPPEPIEEEPHAEEMLLQETEELPEKSETIKVQEQADADWITEEPLPDDFDTELPVMQKIVSEEPVLEENTVLEALKEPDKEPEIQTPVSEEPEIQKPVTKKSVKKEPAAKKPAAKEPEATPEMIVKKQPEEKKVKKEVKEEQEEILMPTLEEDTPNARDILEDMADYSEETTVITKGVVVKGDIISGGSINVLGEVEGNITCKGKLMVSGTVHGNAEAGELFANDAHITGNILNAGSVKIGQGSIIIGNVTGSSAVIAGAIKGDIDVKGPVVVDSTAIIMGDIKSKSVQINNGAAIEGRCSQCYADVNPTSFFKEN